MRTIMISAAAIAGAGILLLTATRHVVRAEHDDDEEKYLFVWAGDQARTNPDFLAVLDFNEHSPAYGNVITTLGLPNPGAAGNEPHHVGLSADGRVLAAGGLLSLLKGQKEVFFFDVSNPKTPRFLSSADPPLSAITDDFYALPGGGFLVTMMGSAMGHAPGRVAEFDRNLNLVAEHPAMPPADGFNPYGISCSAGIELDGDERFHLPLDHAGCDAGRARSPREHSSVGPTEPDDSADHPDSGCGRNH